MNATLCYSLRTQALRCSHVREISSKASRKPRYKRKAASPTPPPEVPPEVEPATSEPEPLDSSTVLSHTTLPPAKMRALIALYHQADTWVTPETLLERIDQTFIHKLDHQPGTADSTGSSTARTITMDEINNAKRAILEAPKLSKWDIGAGAPLALRRENNASSGSWANNRATRERRVIEALYGVVAAPDAKQKLMPGLEVVKEAQQWMAKAAEADKQEGIAQEQSEAK